LLIQWMQEYEPSRDEMGGEEPNNYTRPTGLAPAGPLRDHQSEQRRAIAKATANDVAEAKPQSVPKWTALGRRGGVEERRGVQRVKGAGARRASAARAQASAAVVVTDSQRQRRLAAASRWYKARLAKALAAGEAAPSSTASQVQQVVAPIVRHARRGEFDLIAGSYRQYTTTELLELVYKVRDKQLKTSELANLYANSAIRVPNKLVEAVLYPKADRDKKVAKLEASGLITMGAPCQL
jgi:hypothetical protein